MIVDVDLGENQVPGALESVCDHNETVRKSLELRNIKIKVKELPIPVAFAAAFEGEIIRKSDMHNECWSAKNPTAELVVMRELNEVDRINIAPLIVLNTRSRRCYNLLIIFKVNQLSCRLNILTFHIANLPL